MKRKFLNDPLPTFWQPIVRESFNIPFSRTLNAAIQLTASPALDALVINVTASHGLVAGNLVYIVQSGVYYLGTVLSVNTNAITLDTPLNSAFDHTASHYVLRLTDAMNVNGSSTAVKFAITPPTSMIWSINRLIVFMTFSSAGDDGLFGNIAALTRGVVLRLCNGTRQNKANFKTNGELAAICESLSYVARSGGQGSYGLRATYSISSQNTGGNSFVLDGSASEKLELIVQDDISSLTTFKCFAQGMVDA